MEAVTIPTLIPTASVYQHLTEVSHTLDSQEISGIQAKPSITTNSAIPPTFTPIPTAIASETPTQTWTPSPIPTSTATSLPTATNTPSPEPTNTSTQIPTAVLPTKLPVATNTPVPPTVTLPPTAIPPPANTIPNLELIPGQPQGYLDKFRLLTYYGSPLGSGLGKLGDYSRDYTLRLIRGDVALYQALSPDRLVVPTYHMVTTVANPYPPEYRHHVSLGVMEEWIASAKATGVAVILDIQPGRANLMDEFYRIRYLLYEPHVHLAVDPEFVMDDTQVPGVHLGQLYASQINEIQVNLNGIGYEIGLNRVFILHQFADRMLPDKELIQSYPFVEMVIDGDGFGSPYVKISNYNQYAGEPGFEYGGFKLFPTDGDTPLMSPEWVMSALFPPPVIIIYQ